MKKIISLLLCLSLIVGLLPGVFAAEGDAYLSMGDSITAGTALNEGEPAFPQLLAEANGWNLTNLGVDGQTAGSLLAAISDGSCDEAIASAKIITITAGGNDVMDALYELVAEAYNAENDPDINPDDVVPILADSNDSRWMKLLLVGMEVLEGDDRAGIPPFAEREEFLAKIDECTVNLKAVMAYIRNLNPDATVIVPTQYNPYKNFSGLYKIVGTSVDAGARKLNAAIESIAEECGYLVAPVFDAFQNSSENLCNATTSPMNLDFHPNARGHEVIAQVEQETTGGVPRDPAPTDPDPAEPEPTEPDPAEPEPTEPEPTEPEPTEPEPTEPEPTEPEPTEPEPTEPEPTEPEPTEPVEPEPVKNPFTDVKEKDYFYQPVLWAVERGITAGVSATRFAPNDSCTRAQVVTFLWRAAGCPEPRFSKNPFKDVKSTDYYYKAVLWAVENAVTAGTSADRFSPNAPCTRAQVVTFLYRALDGSNPTFPRNPFSDVDTSDYYFSAVVWAVSTGITYGVDDSHFGSNLTCTRGQVVSFLYRAY